MHRVLAASALALLISFSRAQTPPDNFGTRVQKVGKKIQKRRPPDPNFIVMLKSAERVVDPDNLGAAQEKAGNFEEAIAIFRAASPSEDYLPNAARIAWLQFLQGDHEAGRKTIAAQPDFATQPISQGGSERAYRAAALAELLRAGGHDKEALYYYFQAKSGPYAEVLFQIGSIYLNRGDYGGAKRQYAAIWERMREDPSATALALIGEGLLALKHGNPEGGQAKFEQALQKSEEGAANYPKALALEQLGRASLLMRDYGTSERQLAAAISFQSSLGMTARSAQLALGDLYMKTARPEKALEIYRRERAGVSLAYWQFSTGHFKEARRQIELMLPAAEKSGYTDPLFALHTMRGLIEEKMGELDLAAASFKKACDISERLRKRTFVPLYIERYGIAASEPYEGLVRTSPSTADGLPVSFAYADLTKSGMFARSPGDNAFMLGTGLPDIMPPWATRVNRMSPLMVEEWELENPLGPRGYKTVAEYLEDTRKLEKATDEYIAAVSSVSALYPEFGDRVYPKPLTLATLHLRPDERIIEFEVTALDTRVFIVSSGSLLLSYTVALTRTQLMAEIDKYRLYFNSVKTGEDLARFDPKLAGRLYDILLRPAFTAKSSSGVALIPQNSEVIIVPDEFLGAVPFESLVTSLPKVMVMPSNRFGPTPTGLRYLADDYDITYQHSTTFLMSRRRVAREPTNGKLLVLADAIFEESDPRSRALISKVSTGTIKTMGLGGKRTGESSDKKIGREQAAFLRLDRTALLADALTTKVFPGGDSVVLQGASASERELRKVDLSSFTYLLFATHGVLDNTLPGVRESALVLNQVGNDEGYDGFLTETEVKRMKFNADIVVLTACQTGLGKSVAGEGMMGLGRAFQRARTNVLVSLWNVSENSSTILAEQFFRHVKSGASPRQALRLARQDVRREGYEHPFYWAPFVLYGN